MRRFSPMTFLRLPAVALSAALLFAPAAVRAEQGEIIKEFSVTNTERILEALKIEYKEVRPGLYSFNLGGYPTLLLNKGTNLEFYASFKKKVTMGRINDWNAGKRYTRAYINKEGNPVLEADLDLEGGVSYGAIAEFFKTWVTSVKLFTQHIGLQG
jgi:Putative bacterial sensory transduction regulator